MIIYFGCRGHGKMAAVPVESAGPLMANAVRAFPNVHSSSKHTMCGPMPHIRWNQALCKAKLPEETVRNKLNPRGSLT